MSSCSSRAKCARSSSCTRVSRSKGAQLCFGLHAPGDVLVDAEAAGELAVGHQRDGVELDVHLAAVLAAPNGRLMDNFATHHALTDIDGLGVPGEADQIVGIAADDLVLGVLEHPLERRVAESD